MPSKLLSVFVAASLAGSSTAALAQPVPATETVSSEASTLRGVGNAAKFAGVTFVFVAFLLFLFHDDIFDDGDDGFGGGEVPTSP